MNIKISKPLRLAVVLTLLAAFMTSCGSISTLMKDPDFQRGFRAGWNSTAPEEYRY